MSSHWLVHALKLSFRLTLQSCSTRAFILFGLQDMPATLSCPILAELVHPEHVLPVSSAIWSQHCARRDVQEAWSQGGSRWSAQACGPTKRLELLLLALFLDLNGHVNRVQRKVCQVYVGLAWWRQCREVEVAKLVYVGFPCSCHVAWAHTAATAD